jgi:aminomethyltransferase
MVRDEEYMLVVNAANIQKDWDWISGYNQTGAQMENISDNITLLAVQGPKAINVLSKLTTLPLEEMGYYTFAKGNINDITDGAIVSATGYTGSGGFELYMYNEFASDIWDALFEAGKEEGIKPVGLAARDTLRLEMGFCLYGNDIDDTTSPIEAGLGWITKFTKDFINADFLRKQKEAGTNRKLAGFKMIDRGIPRHGYEIYNANEEKIGHVTSGTISPSLGQGIGLGYVSAEYAKSGTEIYIQIRNKKIKAEVARPPFYKP